MGGSDGTAGRAAGLQSACTVGTVATAETAAAARLLSQEGASVQSGVQRLAGSLRWIAAQLQKPGVIRPVWNWRCRLGCEARFGSRIATPRRKQ